MSRKALQAFQLLWHVEAAHLLVREGIGRVSVGEPFSRGRRTSKEHLLAIIRRRLQVCYECVALLQPIWPVMQVFFGLVVEKACDPVT
jgi:hypothetical protein